MPVSLLCTFGPKISIFFHVEAVFNVSFVPTSPNSTKVPSDLFHFEIRLKIFHFSILSRNLYGRYLYFKTLNFKINGKTAKKRENGTKFVKFARSVFFLYSRHNSKKKNVLQQSSGGFLAPKKGSIYKRNCKIAKNSRNQLFQNVNLCKNIRSFRF
jgi:hypothetical protein